ncbi:MAG: hypothetical protein R2939_09570 [Kofleriaceae bacterium]
MSRLDRFRALEQRRDGGDDVGEGAAPPASTALQARFAGVAPPPAAAPPAPAPAPVDAFAPPPDDGPLDLGDDDLDGGVRRCMHCAHENPRFARTCGGCGGGLEHAAQRRFDQQRAADARARRAAEAHAAEAARVEVAQRVSRQAAAEAAEDAAEEAASARATLARLSQLGPLGRLPWPARAALSAALVTVIVVLFAVPGVGTGAVQLVLAALVLGLWLRSREP